MKTLDEQKREKFEQWLLLHQPDIERDLRTMCKRLQQKGGKAGGGAGLMRSLKTHCGEEKYKGTNDFGPYLAKWFLGLYPEFGGVVGSK